MRPPSIGALRERLTLEAPSRARPTAQIADELPRVVVQPSTLTSAPSAGQREQPLMIRSTLSSPMMTTGVFADRVVSRSGVWLEGMAGIDGEVFHYTIDDVVRRRCVRPQAGREAPEQP